MPKIRSKVWHYLEEAKPLLPLQPATQPYVDIFTKSSNAPIFYGKDATVATVKLCFKNPVFVEQRPLERADLALSLDEDTREGD